MSLDHSITVLRTLAFAVLLFFSSAIAAQSLNTVLAADIRKNQANEASQERIDNIVSATDKLASDYRQSETESDGLEIYTQLLQTQVDDQVRQMTQFEDSMKKVDVIERQIVPQMKKMIDALEDFVGLDVPFLQEERRNRVSRLNRLLADAEVSTAQKFRSVVEAYQIEAEYGRTIEKYSDSISDDSGTFEVDVLRIGRIGLYWQNADASITRGWDNVSRSWVDLGNEYRSAVRNGLKIADDQKAPELLLLPVSAPEAS